ncbi:hypothetical protein ABXN37_08000 [Piscinibacter sakaiensis]|uniref:DUF5678 domain-containing protein n=1 Tax=Piscinibacter sakaiensis TaxID=1547922 RepID=A0A0K8NXJ7_PISS1|nr:hypothetical protein [Piscinibacter sakaiensis]GAP35098.1 hypothetical protein ISF6_0663 [Piscinibacter sakaiensis]
MSTLDREFQTYQRHLPQLLERHERQFVVIQGERVEHFGRSYEAALEWAYGKFGLDQPFFVKEVVSEQESVAHFTRDLGLCRT